VQIAQKLNRTNIQIKQFQTGPTGTTCTGAPQTPATALSKSNGKRLLHNAVIDNK